MVKIYHAYEVYTDSSITIGVDTDPVKFLLRMAEDLKAADGSLERVILGRVEGESVEDALNSVRASGWLENVSAAKTTACDKGWKGEARE